MQLKLSKIIFKLLCIFSTKCTTGITASKPAKSVKYNVLTGFSQE